MAWYDNFINGVSNSIDATNPSPPPGPQNATSVQNWGTLLNGLPNPLTAWGSAGSGAYDDIHNAIQSALGRNRAGPRSPSFVLGNRQPIYPSQVGAADQDAASVEAGLPVNQAAATAGAAPVSQSNAPQFSLPQRPTTPTPPPRPINLGYGAPGVGQPNWNDAALGSQIMGDGGADPRAYRAQAPVQGPLSALAGNQQPQSSPFTMVLRPNAPAEGGGRGGGGTPLGTALDLSGYQPQAPAADPAYRPDPRFRAQAPAPAPVARAPAARQGWRGFPQVQPGGVGVMRPTWGNPAVGGSTVGMGN